MNTIIFLLKSFLLLNFTLELKGETNLEIRGFVDESVDLVCDSIKQDNIPTVARYLGCNLTAANNIGKFVLSTWNQTIDNYTIHCTINHPLYQMCMSMMTSYVTNNQTHFVIKEIPRFLNEYKTRCKYDVEGFNRPKEPGNVQVIKLQDKIKGYVEGRIKIECIIPTSHDSLSCKKWQRWSCTNMTIIASLRISQKKNGFLQRVKIDQANVTFSCLNPKDNIHYDFCRKQMKLSYVNGSSIVFVVASTPPSLNNTILYWHVKFQGGHDCIEVHNHSDEIEKKIVLHNKDNTKESTTTPPTGKKTSNESTPTPPTDKNSLSCEEIVGIVVGVLVFVIFVIIIYKIIKINREARNGERTENANSCFLECRSKLHAPNRSSNTADECD